VSIAPVAVLLFVALFYIPRMSARFMDYMILLPDSTVFLIAVDRWVVRGFGWIALVLAPLVVGLLAPLIPIANGHQPRRRRRLGVLLAIVVIVITLVTVFVCFIRPWMTFANQYLRPTERGFIRAL
jgi:hypothetical protein